MSNPHQKDTGAWIFQVWTSFLVSFSFTLVGVYLLPVDLWTKGFTGMGLLFTVASTFTLAKTVRDNHEAERMHNRIQGAKTEKMLRDYEFVDAA